VVELPVGAQVSGGEAGRPGRSVRAGRHVTLTPIDPEAHVDALFRASHDGSSEGERVWTYLPYGPFADVEEMGAWAESIRASDDPLFLTVLAGDRPVGVVSFMSIEPEMRRLEIGHIWYAPSAQRTEANTEAVYLMLREAFDELGHRRVEWKCDALNARSRAAAERLGFTFEGIFRQHKIVKGRNRDTAWYSMIDREWPRAREAFEAWLPAPPEARPPLASLRSREDR